MIALKSPLQLTTPPTLEKQLEALAALRTLQAQDQELVRQRRAEIVALRRDFEVLQQDVAALGRRLVSDVRADVLRTLKYDPDQSGAPKSLRSVNRQSGADAPSAYQKAAADDPEHPGWPAGAADGKGGQFRPKDGNGAQSPANSEGPNEGPAKPGVQYAAREAGSTRSDAREVALHSEPQRPKDDDAGAAESGGKFEDGAYPFDASLHDKVMQALMDRTAASGYDGLRDWTYHSYATGWDLVCATGDSCTLENARASVLAYQVPGYDGTVIGGEKYPVTVPTVGYIGDVLVYDNGTSISNEALPNHLLYYGYVTNRLEVRSDGIYVQTIGEGVNTSQALAQMNEFFGPSLFSQQHVLMRQHFNAHFASSP